MAIRAWHVSAALSAVGDALHRVVLELAELCQERVTELWHAKHALRFFAKRVKRELRGLRELTHAKDVGQRRMRRWRGRHDILAKREVLRRGAPSGEARPTLSALR